MSQDNKSTQEASKEHTKASITEWWVKIGILIKNMGFKLSWGCIYVEVVLSAAT